MDGERDYDVRPPIRRVPSFLTPNQPLVVLVVKFML